MPCLPIALLSQSFSIACHKSLSMRRQVAAIATPLGLFLTLSTLSSPVMADSMSALIMQKSVQPVIAAPSARVSTRSTIQRTQTTPTVSYRGNTVSPATAAKSPDYISQRYPNTYAAPSVYPPMSHTTARYPDVTRSPKTLPAFLSGNYDNVDAMYLPLLSSAETGSSSAARKVISTARAMTLNERLVIKGGCWDYLNAVFNRAGVSKNTVHKGVYKQGPYASSSDIQVGDWLYYINHGYNDIEHSGLFVGWVDESAKQALIMSYAGESRREPARYRVYDLSHVYHIMRPMA